MTRKQIVTRFHLFLLGVLVAITGDGRRQDPGRGRSAGALGPQRPARSGLAAQLRRWRSFPVIGVLLDGSVCRDWPFRVPPEQIEPGRYAADAMLTGLLLIAALRALQFSHDPDRHRLGHRSGAHRHLSASRLIHASPRHHAAEFGAQRLCRRAAALDHEGSRPTGRRRPSSDRHPLRHRRRLALAVVAWFRPDPVDMLPAIGAAVLFVPIVIGGLFSFIRRKALKRRASRSP